MAESILEIVEYDRQIISMKVIRHVFMTSHRLRQTMTCHEVALLGEEAPTSWRGRFCNYYWWTTADAIMPFHGYKTNTKQLKASFLWSMEHRNHIYWPVKELLTTVFQDLAVITKHFVMPSYNILKVNIIVNTYKKIFTTFSSDIH